MALKREDRRRKSTERADSGDWVVFKGKVGFASSWASFRRLASLFPIQEPNSSSPSFPFRDRAGG